MTHLSQGRLQWDLSEKCIWCRDTMGLFYIGCWRTIKNVVDNLHCKYAKTFLICPLFKSSNTSCVCMCVHMCTDMPQNSQLIFKCKHIDCQLVR